jgi:hypothetical protein
VRLRNAGASRELLRHVDDEGDILQAWDTCPRGTWSIELIARGGVRRTVTAHALVKLSNELRNELLETFARQYGSGELDTEGLILGVDAALGCAIDAMDDVAKISEAAGLAQRRHQRDEVQRLALLHDDAYAHHHLQMARLLRSTVSRDIVRTAFGVATGPYR